MTGHGHGAPAGTGAEEFWTEHYRRHERVWSGNANAVLVDIAGPLAPTTALDLGCGEGGDAIWLARRGWRVTAVDVTDTVLHRAAGIAADAGVAGIDWQRHDLAATFPTGSWGLVSAQFLQSPLEFPREAVLRAAAGAVAPGGLLLVVAHAAGPSWSPQAHDPDLRFPTPEGDLAALDLDAGRWRVDRAEVVSREVVGPDGQAGTLLDSVVAVTRLA